MDTQTTSIHYVHNLLAIHFNVGGDVALLVNDIMRHELDLFYYCIERAKKCTSFVQPYYFNVPGFAFFRTESSHLHWKNYATYPKDQPILSFHRYPKSFQIDFALSPYFIHLIEEQSQKGRIFWIWFEWNKGTPVSERQFHYEIDKIFQRFMEFKEET